MLRAVAADLSEGGSLERPYGDLVIAIEAERLEEARALLMQPLELLDKQGRLHGNSLDETRQVTWSFLHGTISLQWIRPDEVWVPNLLDAEIDAMIRGCVRPPTHSSAREGNSS